MSQRPRSSIKLNLLDKKILNRLQDDIPFTSRPWERIARGLGIEEDLLLDKVAGFKKSGVIRRISAVFSPRKINFVSTLVGVKVGPADIAKVVKKINAYPEVTHNYRRDGAYAIWFTLVAPDRTRVTRILREIGKIGGIKKMSEFGAVKLFKINVRFSV